MATNDLLRAVSSGSRRAGIPSGNAALSVKQQDGIIPHALHKRPQLLLAFPQGFLGSLLFRDVVDDTQHRSAFGSLHRTEHDVDREFASILASSVEFNSSPHRPHPVFRVKGFAVGRMSASKSLRNQGLNRLTQ